MIGARNGFPADMAEEIVELSPEGWVAGQTRKILETGTTEGVEVTGRPIVLLTLKGAKSGKLRYTPVMRVEHGGAYAVVASKGGAPEHPTWYHNIKAHPEFPLQDGTRTRTYTAREVSGEERAAWWERAVEAFPPYAEYQTRTDREIPVFVLEPAE
jgi:deazaflavin-dependent oxidoreductase (nitroreductase family)